MNRRLLGYSFVMLWVLVFGGLALAGIVPMHRGFAVLTIGLCMLMGFAVGYVAGLGARSE